MNDLVKFSRHVRASETGLEISAGLSYADWVALGDEVQRAAASSMWWLGDWWAFGEKQGYGERYAASAQLPFAKQTLRNAGTICRAFEETSRRRDVLTYTHHAEVVVKDITERQQDRLLDKAIKHNWSKRELRKEVRAFRHAKNKKDPPPHSKRSVRRHLRRSTLAIRTHDLRVPRDREPLPDDGAGRYLRPAG